MIPRTRAGLIQFRPVTTGGRVALVAPASAFDRGEFDRGLVALADLGFEAVYDDSIFDRDTIVAGTAATRAEALTRAMTRPDVDAVMAVRGGYGSAEILPLIDAGALARQRTAFIGYSDLTSLHAFLNGRSQLASVHGPMIEGRIAAGESHYDRPSFLGALSATPIGEMAPSGVEVLRGGEASGPLFGGTLVQVASSLGTPFAFRAPAGAVLFLEDVGERPYRLRRDLNHLKAAGVFQTVSGLVFGQMTRCDEPSGSADAPTARSVIREFFADFAGPVLYGFPSGHTTTPFFTLPFGVQTRIITGGWPGLVFEEAAAA